MAIKAQSARLQAESTRAAAKTITAITLANPPVVSSATHGFTAGQIVYIENIAGMVELNGRAFVVANPAAGTFELKGINATGYTAYTSGGSASLITLTDIAEVTSVSGFDGEASEIDTTNLRSTAKEYLVGLQDFGNVSLNVLLNNGDAGQTLLRTIKGSASAKVFSLTLSDAKVSAFVGLVKQFSFDASADAAVTGQVSIRVTGEPSWFA
ncbi:Phage tail tube protein 3 [uncultured Caudovirales phage]|uniref:Phage tail tube protein 3 n=1 Tax=uncultured Caudovirales phage TaxID=2100421 RepID=A0A6J5N7V1_9CAUD|nr:Phage tail tube protein 3 [uncultured Caudovirales phage]